MLSLHKGWLAFGVELDSFCERDTSPTDVSINNVGMQSLLSSKLYGISASSTMVSCTSCTSSADNGIYNTGHTCGAGCTTGTPSGTGPGKHSFIGFGDENCGNLANVNNVQVLGDEGGTRTTNETRCELNISDYTLGVGGHLSGTTYIGINVDHNGVVDEQDEDGSANVFNTTHANGICA